jgi:hypothetical protein
MPSCCAQFKHRDTFYFIINHGEHFHLKIMHESGEISFQPFLILSGLYIMERKVIIIDLLTMQKIVVMFNTKCLIFKRK